MNTMSHKGYTARVEFDDRDNIFVGRVLGTRTIIGFHGETVDQLRAEFQAAVEDFIRDCKEQGVKPEKPASGKLLLRVPPEVHGAPLFDGDQPNRPCKNQPDSASVSGQREQ